MRVNYKAIADRAEAIIGSADSLQYEIAYDAMILETTTTDLESAWYNEIDLMSTLGASEADALLDKIEANVSPRMVRMIQSEKGINLADPQTKGMLAALKAGGAITAGEETSLLDLTKEDKSDWPGLKNGHVQNALEYRAGGIV